MVSHRRHWEVPCAAEAAARLLARGVLSSTPPPSAVASSASASSARTSSSRAASAAPPREGATPTAAPSSPDTAVVAAASSDCLRRTPHLRAPRRQHRRVRAQHPLRPHRHRQDPPRRRRHGPAPLRGRRAEALATLRDLSIAFKDRVVLLGVDDVDLFKGIGLEFPGIERLLEKRPELRGRALLVQIVQAFTETAHSPKFLGGLHDRLEALDDSNAANRALSPRFAAGTSDKVLDEMLKWSSDPMDPPWSSPSAAAPAAPASTSPPTRTSSKATSKTPTPILSSLWPRAASPSPAPSPDSPSPPGSRSPSPATYSAGRDAKFVNSELSTVGTFVDTCQDSFDEFPDVDGSPLANVQTNLSRLVSNSINLVAYKAA
uniref:Uncharacterized protein n=1 Tax=Ananas comosus var. bracteatus TaxID=296719 RepID=A0A6V7PKX4_ANACO|nr:unnamed protein product [Ananas comosus var. bracteatus]